MGRGTDRKIPARYKNTWLLLITSLSLVGFDLSMSFCWVAILLRSFISCHKLQMGSRFNAIYSPAIFSKYEYANSEKTYHSHSSTDYPTILVKWWRHHSCTIFDGRHPQLTTSYFGMKMMRGSFGPYQLIRVWIVGAFITRAGALSRQVTSGVIADDETFKTSSLTTRKQRWHELAQQSYQQPFWPCSGAFFPVGLHLRCIVSEDTRYPHSSYVVDSTFCVTLDKQTWQEKVKGGEELSNQA